MMLVKKFEKRVTKREKRIKNPLNLINIEAENIPFCLDAVNEGKKLWVNAPSAKIRRKRFGNLKATINISVYILAPRTEACNKSRIRPKIREKSMPKLLVNMDFIIDESVQENALKGRYLR